MARPKDEDRPWQTRTAPAAAWQSNWNDSKQRCRSPSPGYSDNESLYGDSLAIAAELYSSANLQSSQPSSRPVSAGRNYTHPASAAAPHPVSAGRAGSHPANAAAPHPPPHPKRPASAPGYGKRPPPSKPANALECGKDHGGSARPASAPGNRKENGGSNLRPSSAPSSRPKSASRPQSARRQAAEGRRPWNPHLDDDLLQTWPNTYSTFYETTARSPIAAASTNSWSPSATGCPFVADESALDDEARTQLMAARSKVKQLRARVEELEKAGRQARQDVKNAHWLQTQIKQLEEKAIENDRLDRQLQDELETQEASRALLERYQHQCLQSCCLPLVRLDAALEKDPTLLSRAMQNEWKKMEVETSDSSGGVRQGGESLVEQKFEGLDAQWAGYVFGHISLLVASSGLSFHEVFKKYAQKKRTLNSTDFRSVIHQLNPDIKPDQLTLLFFYADVDGSGQFDFLEFIRIFGRDVNGDMCDEYFTHTMARIADCLQQEGSLLKSHRTHKSSMDAPLKTEDFLNLCYESGGSQPNIRRVEARKAFEMLRRILEGDCTLHTLDIALQQCKDAVFSGEQWVQVIVCKISEVLKAPDPVAIGVPVLAVAAGELSYADLAIVVRKIDDNFRSSRIDRLAHFLDKKRTGNIPFKDVHQAAVDVSLGSSRSTVSVGSRLAGELMEKCTMQFLQRCGSLESAFSWLDPCLDLTCLGNGLKKLGLDNDVDVKELLRFLDVSAKGKLKKGEFMLVLSRYCVQSQNLGINIKKFRTMPFEIHSIETTARNYSHMDVGVLEATHLMSETRGGASGSVSGSRIVRSPSSSKDSPKKWYSSEHVVYVKQGTNSCNAPDSSLPSQANLLVVHEVAVERVLLLEILLRLYGMMEQNLSDDRVTGFSTVSDRMKNLRKICEDLKARYVAMRGKEKDEDDQLLDLSSLTVRMGTDALYTSKFAPVTSTPSMEGLILQEISTLQNDIKKNAKDATANSGCCEIVQALEEFHKTGSQKQLLKRISSATIGGRFLVRAIIQVESDAVVLRCADSLLDRDVVVKVPISSKDHQKRLDFLHECVVYALLRDVPQVSKALHFTGLSEGLLYCAMELLQGSLLADRFQHTRRRAVFSFTEKNTKMLSFYEAAEVCDALLSGVANCHKHGVLHLDIKPSTVWEVQQPAEVVVKLLDFGNAEVISLARSTPAVKELIQQRRQRHRNNPMNNEGLWIEIDPSATAPPGAPQSVPEDNSRLDEWRNFVPSAVIPGVGSPMYMSPERWCFFLQTYERSQRAFHPLKWCQDSAGRALKFTDDIGGAILAEIRQGRREDKCIAQSMRAVPQFPQGAYYEIVIRKDWPAHKLRKGSSGPDDHVGLAVGFTSQAPIEGCLPERAFEMAHSWVVGYDGRFYIDQEEVEHPQDVTGDGDHALERLSAMRGRGEGMSITKSRVEDVPTPPSSSSSSSSDEEEQDTDDSDSPRGHRHTKVKHKGAPLGFSFTELRRGDRIGILATYKNTLVMYVNGHEMFRLNAPGLDGSDTLYALVEVCGTVKAVSLIPTPEGPPGHNEGDVQGMRNRIGQLAETAMSYAADIYGCALVIQRCFHYGVEPAAPLALAKLLVGTQQWFEKGRPSLTMRGDVLNALSDWCDACGQEVAGSHQAQIMGVPTRIAGVVRQALSRPAPTAEKLRALLNAQTSWSSMSSEFLQSIMAISPDGEDNSATQDAEGKPLCSFALRTFKKTRSEKPVLRLWDLSPWTLSASHIRKVVEILSAKTAPITLDAINLSRLVPRIPEDLRLRFVGCLKQQGKEREKGANGYPKPRLIFNGLEFPQEECPFGLDDLRILGATSFVLHFVRSASLCPRSTTDNGAELRPVMQESDALDLSEALRGNCALRSLHLREQEIGFKHLEAFASALRENSVLRCLDLTGCSITEGGVVHLADALQEQNSSALETLYLCGNSFGDAGVASLADMLARNGHLRTLGLAQNELTSDGGVAIADGIMRNDALRYLDVSRNSIGASGAMALLHACRVNESLHRIDLSRNNLDVVAAWQMAGAFKGTSKSVAVDSSSNQLNTFNTPTSILQKSKSRCNDALVPASPTLSRTPSFQELNQNWEVGLVKGQISEVERLLGPKSLGGLQFNALRELSLARNKLGCIGGVRLLEALEGNNSLTMLDLTSNMLGKSAAVALASLLPGAKPTSKGACAIKKWILAYNMLGQEEALPLAIEAAFAPRNAYPNLAVTHLDLSSNCFNPAGISCLAVVLSNLCELSFLQLNQNDLGSETGSASALSALAGRLGPEVKTLALGSCSLLAAEAAAVCRKLRGHPSLQILDLSDNQIGFNAQMPSGKDSDGSANAASNRTRSKEGTPMSNGKRTDASPGAVRLVSSLTLGELDLSDAKTKLPSSHASDASHAEFVNAVDDLVRGASPRLELIQLALNGISDSFGLEHLVRSDPGLPEIEVHIDLTANALSDFREKLSKIMPLPPKLKAED